MKNAQARSFSQRSARPPRKRPISVPAVQRRRSEEPRIHAFLAQEGLGSRREIESWIKEGYVQVNGKPARLGQKIHPTEDKIRVRGKMVSTSSSPSQSVVVALHKPRGIVTTVKDPEGRRTVLDLVPSLRKRMRLFPVGRLDLMSEGLILLTNDGDLADRLTHPRYEIPKVYEVKIRGKLDERKLQHLKIGVGTEEGKFKGAEILNVREVTREGINKYVVVLKVFEGKNHHVRRMFEAIRTRVIRLKRISMGSISVKGITRGGYRVLSNQEIQTLKTSIGLDA